MEPWPCVCVSICPTSHTHKYYTLDEMSHTREAYIRPEDVVGGECPIGTKGVMHDNEQGQRVFTITKE